MAQRALLASRTTGTLQLSGQDLAALPPEAFDPDAATAEGSVNWWEVCELTKLVASHNRIVSLQAEISRLTTLVHLDLGHNELTNLPESLGELDSLKVLDVSANKFSELPTYVGHLPALVRLLCASNSLTSLPLSLGENQPNFAELVASDNKITELPAGLCRCRALVRLNLQSNLIAGISTEALTGMPSLTELNLRQNRLSGSLSPAIGQLSSLKILDLRENALVHLPDEVGNCRALVELHVGHNQLAVLPPGIAGCSCLSVLDARRNSLTTLPEELSGLGLSLLDLTDNNISALPPTLGLITTLRRLPLDGNPLKLIRRDILAGPTPRLLEWLRDKIPDSNQALGQQQSDVRAGNVFGGDSVSAAADAASKLSIGGAGGRQLDLSNSKLTSVPAEVWQAGEGGLSQLDLTSNQITELDPWALAQCTGLVSLKLGRNKLQAWPLPEPQGSLPGLQELLVPGNLIRMCPPMPFASCQATLRRLDLSGVPAACHIPPEALAGLSALEELIASQASLTVFPAGVLVGPLPNLRVLSLGTNQIQELPVEVTLLTKLEELDMSNNDLGALPPQLGLMTTLRSLQVDGNRLRAIRRPVLERGTKALLEYLRDRIPA